MFAYTKNANVQNFVTLFEKKNGFKPYLEFWTKRGIARYVATYNNKK